MNTAPPSPGSGRRLNTTFPTVTWVARPPASRANSTSSSAYNTFAADVPDPELHQLPGTCAHFIVDRDGTIYQLVRLDIMCRHTVGLNYVAIGIEHVGTSDREILHDKAQMRSSLELTAWLAVRFHIRIRNVIGHN